MKVKNVLIFISILLILIMGIDAIAAVDNLNTTLNENDLKESSDFLQQSDEYSLVNSNAGDVISDSSSNSKTVTIVADKTNPNQVLKPTVQPAIDAANPGDTIILKGNFVHCHFTINKTLNIVAAPGASLGPCPHHKHEGVDEFGVFYIDENGSGSLIEGFTFLNNDKSDTPFAFLIRGANDVTINNCSLNYVNPDIDKYSGIIIENSTNVRLSNLFVNNTIYGIRIVNSSNIIIEDSVICNSENYGIFIGNACQNITIRNNALENNKKASIALNCANNVSIISNIIENNGKTNDEVGSGLYVNAEIIQLIVKGNLFLNNGDHAILYDYRCRNLNNENGADKLTIVDNNYFAGHDSMILHHRIYIEHADGDHDYDSENDVFVYVGEKNGKYLESKSYVYMLHAFVVYGEVVCGYTFYTLTIPWTLNAPGNDGKYDLSLSLSNITQIKNGIYNVSIVDKTGQIADDFNSLNVRFYLNNYSRLSSNEGIFKDVQIENGTATVDFTDLKDNFLETGNVITASFPGAFDYVVSNPHVQFNVSDSDIPGVLTETKIIAENQNIVYGEGTIYASLVDNNGYKLRNKIISVLINSKNLIGKTNDDGLLKLSIDENSGKYDVIFNFNGDDDYAPSSTSKKLVISKATPKITVSTLTTYPMSDEYLKIKLTTNVGNALINQMITFKFNGKTYSVKTDKNGIAKVKVSLTNKKSYSVKVTYAGSTNYKPISKTGKIVVKTGSKKSKITAKNIKVKKNAKKIFSLKLTALDGKAISKQKITVKINGKTYVAKTNSKGVAKVTVKLNSPKKYNVSMKFLGNKLFKASSKTNTITVTK